MATLTIRNLPDDVRDRLRVRAARNGRSMEAEAREMLSAAVEGKVEVRPALAERIKRLQAAFAPYRPAVGSVADELIADRRREVSLERDETTAGLGESRNTTMRKRSSRQRRAS